jgi:hypothetical protein
MDSVADALALAALLILSALFAAAFFDEMDPRWAAQGLGARVRAMPVMTGTLLAVWALALLGGMAWPGQLAAWVAGWSFGFVLVLLALLGLAVSLGGVAFLLRQRGLAAEAGLSRRVALGERGYALLLLGLGMVQAALGSH